MYALIGGLCCRAAADGSADVDASPQVCVNLLSHKYLAANHAWCLEYVCCNSSMLFGALQRHGDREAPHLHLCRAHLSCSAVGGRARSSCFWKWQVRPLLHSPSAHWIGCGLPPPDGCSPCVLPQNPLDVLRQLSSTLCAGVVLYVVWRFWEGITAQGSHPAYGTFKNFFTFRLSPLVSGFVYCAYLAFCATLVPKTWRNNAQDVRLPSCDALCELDRMSAKSRRVAVSARSAVVEVGWSVSRTSDIYRLSASVLRPPSAGDELGLHTLMAQVLVWGFGSGAPGRRLHSRLHHPADCCADQQDQPRPEVERAHSPSLDRAPLHLLFLLFVVAASSTAHSGCSLSACVRVHSKTCAWACASVTLQLCSGVNPLLSCAAAAQMGLVAYRDFWAHRERRPCWLLPAGGNPHVPVHREGRRSAFEQHLDLWQCAAVPAGERPACCCSAAVWLSHRLCLCPEHAIFAMTNHMHRASCIICWFTKIAGTLGGRLPRSELRTVVMACTQGHRWGRTILFFVGKPQLGPLLQHLLFA